MTKVEYNQFMSEFRKLNKHIAQLCRTCEKLAESRKEKQPVHHIPSVWLEHKDKSIPAYKLTTTTVDHGTTGGKQTWTDKTSNQRTVWFGDDGTPVVSEDW